MLWKQIVSEIGIKMELPMLLLLLFLLCAGSFVCFSCCCKTPLEKYEITVRTVFISTAHRSEFSSSSSPPPHTHALSFPICDVATLATTRERWSSNLEIQLNRDDMVYVCTRIYSSVRSLQVLVYNLALFCRPFLIFHFRKWTSLLLQCCSSRNSLSLYFVCAYL